MLTGTKQTTRAAVACLFFAVIAVCPASAAQDHVVSPAEIHGAAEAATSARERNVETVTQFMSSPRAKEALKSAHLNTAQVKTGIAKMSDEEVAQLAKRVNKSQADFAAGHASDRDLIWLVLAVVVLILVIIAVR